VVCTLPLMNSPCALALNPVQGRMYAANHTASSISVVRDSALGLGSGRWTAARPARATFTPNPASGSTRLRLGLESPPAAVRLAIYDATGRLARAVTLSPASGHIGAWDVKLAGLPAGVYLCRIQTGDERAAARLVIQR
jgi:hypothetical protein